LGLFFLISRLLPIAAIQEQSGSATAPYLYYYSQSERGVVIERADGTERRVLASGLMPGDHDAGDLAWSPSGRWLAWTSWDYTGYAVYDRLAWIISSDGKNRRSLLDGKDGIEALNWSTNADWLAVLRLTDPHLNLYELYLIDVEQNQIVVTYKSQNVEAQYAFVGWAPDGTRAFFYDTSNQSFTVLSIEGNTTHYEMNETTHEIGSCEALYYVDSYNVPFWKGNNQISYLSPDLKKLLVEIDSNNERFEITAPVSGLMISDVRWSPDSNYALIFGRPNCPSNDSEPMDLWLLSLPEYSLKRISRDVALPYDLALYYDRVFGKFPYQTTFPWSPTQNKVLFVTTDRVLHILTISPFINEKISIPELDTEFWIAYWKTDGKQIIVEAQARINQPPAEPKGPIYVYDLNGKTLTRIPSGNYYIEIAPRSADGQFIGYECKMSDRPTEEQTEGCIRNVTTGAQITLKPLQVELENSNLYWKAFFSWHPTQNWELFAAAYTGNIEHYFYAVTNADGTIQRDLEQGSSGWAAIDWLPSQVHLDTLTN
jgi:hypothetical protein